MRGARCSSAVCMQRPGMDLKAGESKDMPLHEVSHGLYMFEA